MSFACELHTKTVDKYFPINHELISSIIYQVTLNLSSVKSIIIFSATDIFYIIIIYQRLFMRSPEREWLQPSNDVFDVILDAEEFNFHVNARRTHYYHL